MAGSGGRKIRSSEGQGKQQGLGLSTGLLVAMEALAVSVPHLCS